PRTPTVLLHPSHSTHPSTPEIYTLSLHDALPICQTAFKKLNVAVSQAEPLIFLFQIPLLERNHQRNRGLLADRAHAVKQFHEQADRKSTRLNSSHEWISYAVFCLKKKKTVKEQTP